MSGRHGAPLRRARMFSARTDSRVDVPGLLRRDLCFRTGDSPGTDGCVRLRAGHSSHRLGRQAEALRRRLLCQAGRDTLYGVSCLV